MKRSARCIQMLMLLKARGFLTREDLAKELDTNIRNVSEYRKELEEAGFKIVSTRGKLGGYQLDTSCLFPVVGLTNDEHQALIESIEYMKSHEDFLLLPQFLHAMDKVIATNRMETKDKGIYMKSDTATLPPLIKQYIRSIASAKDYHQVVDIRYKSMHAKEYEKIRIHPYEILNDKGNYYCLAYSLKAKDFRNFKFSEERMKDVQVTPYTFVRDPDFQVKNYIGQKGLMSHEVYELDLLFYDECALLVSEQDVGIQPKGEWIDDHCYHLKTIMEGKLSTLHFLLSHGDQCEILAPTEIKEEMKKIVDAMAKQYSLTL